MLSEHTLQFRVEYFQTDGQRRVHHGNYIDFFERGRVEMLRAAGMNYKDLEAEGLMLVVTEMNVKYFAAAEFDDLLTQTTRTLEIRGVRIRHEYKIYRDETLLVSGESTIACVDQTGRPRRLPAFFRRTN
ncbi:Acyl-CoA thioester hydrolase YbgC [Roseimaritima multifibrata]|uniref:Acyl-CoA thioester hydrolase YbgC n=1 Tax=Roseimaritima multifibrata TaxID=1930274 RepID=A0A517ME52_9BACT|nr:thioesterase family protein [Roseimaritima multifibrata]QDS93116.1 Acyl-CoA thioester hydrolase YbgC [Roseimaritima multifibrata]